MDFFVLHDVIQSNNAQNSVINPTMAGDRYN